MEGGGYDESYQERQENEIEFLQAVFPEDFLDLRKNDPWDMKRPPEVSLMLAPQVSMGTSAIRPMAVRLLVKYPTDYPDSPPHLKLEQPQGLSDDELKDLTKEIRSLARERVGEVMMLEIAQHVQAFLHSHNRPQLSLHEEMVRREREREVEERRRQQAEIEASRLKEEERRKQLEEELRQRMSHHTGRGSDDESDSGESQKSLPLTTSSPASNPPTLTPHTQATLPPQVIVAETRDQSQTMRANLPDNLAGQLPSRIGGGGRGRSIRQIHMQRGKCLGQSSTGGYTVYVGLDLESGDLLASYQWELPCSKKADQRRLRQVLSIEAELEGYLGRGVRHGNLLQYLSIQHQHIDNKINVEVVMEYVGGGSVSNLLRNPDTGPVRGETLRQYCRMMLEALSYLHSHGIVHNDVRPSLVFLDVGGAIKLGGFAVIKRLSDLHRHMRQQSRLGSVTTPTADEDPTGGVWPNTATGGKGGKKGDILKLGMLALCLSRGKLEVSQPTTIPDDLPDDLRDFLQKCLHPNELLRLPAHELLHHPFITPSPVPLHPRTLPPSHSTVTHLTANTGGVSVLNQRGSMLFQRSDSIVGSPAKPYLHGCSRLEAEFEELESLGSGGFGDVVMVRHLLDGRVYAIKKIQLTDDPRMKDRITREVELLSQMNHENVVRYYNAWMETYTEEDLKRHSSAASLDQCLEEEGEEVRDEDSSSEGSDYLSSSSTSSVDMTANSDESSSFITFEASKSFSASNNVDVETANHVKERDRATGNTEGEGGNGGVFADDFSDEGEDVIGDLENEVMKTSTTRTKTTHSTADSSDTVVFIDSRHSAETGKNRVGTGERRRRSRGHGQIEYLYIQMEYCENQTLRQLIDSGELYSSPERVWRLFREAVEGLEHIHSKGMIHRDLKPGNIFLDSYGHIKIGDFGLATSYKQMSKQNSMLVAHTSMEQAGDGTSTGVVGTTLYLAPELFLSATLKYSQKVDMYSLGIILFEMCHAPCNTSMERHKLLAGVRRKEVEFPPGFTNEGNREKQVEVIQWLLSHNPHDRPSAKQLLQSPLLPLKMEDEQLEEVLMRTLQSTNSTRYQHLIDKLFSTDAPQLTPWSFYLEPSDNKRDRPKRNKFSLAYTLLEQMVCTKLAAIFTRHGASLLQPPLLCPRANHLHSGPHSVPQFIERNGAVVTLPSDHRLPLAHYLLHQQDVNYLKRYTISRVYHENKVLGSHPREQFEAHFDIVTPSPRRSDHNELVPDAEVMYVVSEVLSEVPRPQHWQFAVLINHMKLTEAILQHCSIPKERYNDAAALLHKTAMGALKVTELEKKLIDKGLTLSPLAVSTLLKLVRSSVPLDESQALLEPLLRDRSKIGALSNKAWQDIKSVVALFRSFGGKEQVLLHPALCPSYQHFSGIVFTVTETGREALHRGQRGQRRHRTRLVPVAVGGRYDKLLSVVKSSGRGAPPPGMCVVGVSVVGEEVMRGVIGEYQRGRCSITKSSALVCWLGHESLQTQCLKLVTDLWSHGVAADLAYESQELDSIEDIQEFCRRSLIPHIVVLSDKELFFERKQVKVRTLEPSGKTSERIIGVAELTEFLQQRQGVDRCDSLEAQSSTRVGGPSNLDSFPSNARPPVNVTVVATVKLSGHFKRKIHDQTLTKLLPLLEAFPSKQPLEILVVDLKTDVLCSLAAEVNKRVSSLDGGELVSVVKPLTDRHSGVNKKYIAKVCEGIEELLNKNVPMIFLYSHSSEHCQTILNSLESLSNIHTHITTS